MKRIWPAAVAILAAALALAVLPGSAAGASTTNLSCNDGTNLSLALDTTTLTDLTGAVNAIDTYPAGSPALSCSLSDPAATKAKGGGGGNPQHDYAVGGGQTTATDCLSATKTENFALSAHVADETTSPAGGTFNLSCSGGVNNGGGNLVAKVDCLYVEGNDAKLSAKVSHSDGVFTGSYAVGSEIFVEAVDNGLPSGTVLDAIGWTTIIAGHRTPCGSNPGTMNLVHGNINVHDADAATT